MEYNKFCFNETNDFAPYKIALKRQQLYGNRVAVEKCKISIVFT